MTRTQHSSGWFDLHKRNGKLATALLTTFVIFYLVSHALSGERGIYVLLKEQHRLEVLHAELDELGAKRKNLEHKVQRLSDGSLDLDLLDEQARRKLSVANPDEITLPAPDPKKP